MQAGVSVAVITPPVGVELSGFVARDQPSVGVRDELFARALYLEQNSLEHRPEHEAERLLWLHADLIGFDNQTARALREEIANALGLEFRQVVLSATHTHAGPATIPLRQAGTPDANYVARLREQLPKLARAAAARTEPVSLRFAQGRCHIACDRRAQSVHSHVDPTLPVLLLDRTDGSSLAVIANYAVHALALSAANRQLSADLPGAAAACVQQQLPGKPEVFITIGGAGNLNPIDQSHDFTAAARLGEQLGRTIAELARQAQPVPDPVLASAVSDVELAFEQIGPRQIQQRCDAMIEPCRARKDNAARRVQAAATQWRDETLALVASVDCPRAIRCDIQAVTIGPARFAAVPAEAFSRLADELRAACGPQHYVLGYANGLIGYVPPRALYPEGGYEVDEAYIFYGHLRLAPGGHEHLRDALITLLQGGNGTIRRTAQSARTNQD